MTLPNNITLPINDHVDKKSCNLFSVSFDSSIIFENKVI